MTRPPSAPRHAAGPPGPRPGHAARARRAVLAGVLTTALAAAAATLTLAAAPPRPPARPATAPTTVTTPVLLAARTSPSPSPAAVPSPPAAASSRTSCGVLDVSCEIGNAITSWLAALARDALRPLLTLAGQTLLSSPQAGAIPAVRSMWTTSLAIADSAYVLLVIIGGVIVMGHETLQTSYSAKDIAPRLVTGFLAANLSLILISRATSIANALSAALAGDGVTPATAASAVLATLTAPLSDGGTFLVLLALAGAVLALVLAAVYVLRLMALVLLTAAAPLALAAWALPQTAWAARWWWRAAHRVPGHPGRAGAGADRRGAGVLRRRVDPPQRRNQRQRAAGADRDLPAVHHDADPLVGQPPRTVGLRPQPGPPRRQVRLLRRGHVPRQPPAARRSRNPASPLRRGQPGPRVGRATRRRRARRGPPARACCTARRRPGNRHQHRTWPGPAWRLRTWPGPAGGLRTGPQPGRRCRAAAAGPRAGTTPRPGRARGAIAGTGREAAAPAAGARPGSRQARPGPAAATPAPRPGPAGPPPARAGPAAAGHAPARPARRAALRSDPAAAQRATRPPAVPGPRPAAFWMAAAGHARPPPSPAVPPAAPPPSRAARPAAPSAGRCPQPRQAPASAGAARPGR